MTVVEHVVGVQVFVDNLVHGDLHPGNILVQKCPPRPVVHSNSKGLFKRLREMADNAVALVSPPLPLRLVLLDCGICKSLSEHDLTNLRRVFKAIVLGQVSDLTLLLVLLLSFRVFSLHFLGLMPASRCNIKRYK